MKALRRATNTSKPDRRVVHNGTMTEETPLLGAEASVHEHQAFWRHVFLDTKPTPGLGSSQFLTKASAQTWHTFKVTLTNSELILLFVLE